jgi:hypothetical protein
VLSFKPTDFLAGLKETYRWYLRHHTKRETDYAYEDRLLGLAQTQAVAQAQAAH